MATVGEKMTAIADAIRTKTGKTDKLTLDAMASNLNAIAERTSSNLTASGATVTVPAGNYKAQATKSVSTVTRADTTISVSADDTNDKLTITASNNQGTGYVTGANKTATKTITLTASGSSITASDGTNKVRKSVATATQATPSISVNSSGLITASATQTAGYVSAGTKSNTKQLTTKAAATITPKTSNQTIASGTYLTGTQTIKGDANLVASNIKKGTSIFGVSGSYEATGLNFTVVGGTTQPSNPSENTIWINTSTTISGWEFSATQPTATTGKVWFNIDTFSSISFNALTTNCINIYPSMSKQYISGVWTEKPGKIYQNGSWKEFFTGLYLFNAGDLCTNITGGWSLANTQFFDSATLEDNCIDFVTSEEISNNIAIERGQYTKLCVQTSHITGSLTVAFTPVRGDYGAYVAIASTIVTELGVTKIDISEINVPFYIGIYVWNTPGGTCKITKIWLEK